MWRRRVGLRCSRVGSASALAYETIGKTEGRPGLAGRALRVAAVCAAVALLSGCGGWPYIGPVPSSDYQQPYSLSPPGFYAPEYSAPVQQGYIPYPPPPWPSPPQPAIAEPEPERSPSAARPDTIGGDHDPAALLPVPPAPRPDRPGGDTAANGSPRNPTTELPPAGPAPPPPTAPAGEDDACVGAWRICHFL